MLIKLHQNRRLPSRTRRGLAPMELVLWLPVLLFMAALIINYGTMATWRIRGEIVSHDAAFRERAGRWGGTEGRLSGEWPADATLGTAVDPPITQLDDPFINHPVVRGPLPNGFIVRQVLDPDREGAYRGISSVSREYPLLPRLGDYDSGEIAGPLLDRKWTNWEMGIPNRFRRIVVLYELPKTDSRFPEVFRSAFVALLRIPHCPALRVLDRYEDIRLFEGRYHDFHPRINRICELDREAVRRSEVNRLIDWRTPTGDVVFGEISRLPRHMTTYLLRMYRAAVRRMEDRIEQLEMELRGPPPPSPQRRAEIQREIAQLRAEIERIRPMIEQLQAYFDRMPEIEAGIADRAREALDG